MLILLKSHFRDRFIFYSIAIGFVFFVITSWFIFGKINWDAERLVLHYNIIFGVDRLGEAKELWYLFFGAVGVLFFNYFLSLFLYAKDKILARMIMFLGGIWQIFMFVAVYLIVSLNS